MDDGQLTRGFTGRHRSPLMRRLAAMAAPIAADAGAVIDDEQMLDVARAVWVAFSHDDAVGGLTKAEIAGRIGGACPAAALEGRLGVFERLGLLRPILDKKHQQRYVLAPAGLAGMPIVDRFSKRGGVEELLALLDRTAGALERHEADAPAVGAALESCRAAMFAVFANELTRLVANAPLSELLSERRFHDDSGFIRRVADLQRLVTDQFPQLDPGAYTLLLEAQRYVSTVEDMLARVLDEGGDVSNFSLLDAEEYLDAARTATVEDFAAVAADLVFDPALPWVDAGAVIDAVGSYRPRRATRTRPPEPPAASDEDRSTRGREAARSNNRAAGRELAEGRADEPVHLEERHRAVGDVSRRQGIEGRLRLRGGHEIALQRRDLLGAGGGAARVQKQRDVAGAAAGLYGRSGERLEIGLQAWCTDRGRDQVDDWRARRGARGGRIAGCRNQQARLHILEVEANSGVV
jgi:hypothetical protein